MKHLAAHRAARLAEAIGLALTLLATAGGALAQPSMQGRTTVRIDGGSVRGTAANGVIVFKGIPFARPPIGALRWRPPQPVAPWRTALDALAFRADCVQPGSARGSEDCLYLNVWRPAVAPAGPLPVMVWIHGGGLVRGGASLYPGDALARQGIVFVSANYRLGRLGFFAHPALAREDPDAVRGNYGYMDQLAALRWVRRNIAAFGGDTGNVTLAGESGGGGSVLVMLTSPLATGLFQRAILESPYIPSPRAGAGPMRELAAAEQIAVDYARANAIEGDGPAALTALRALPASMLAEGTENYVAAIFGGPEIPGLSHAIVDGRLVVEPPEATLRAGGQARVPVIIGTNDRDLAYTPLRSRDALFASFGPSASQARALYDPRGDAAVGALVQAIAGDRAMVEPARYLAELVTRAGQPAYLYRFSYVPELRRDSVPGAVHGAEVPFAFDLVSALLQTRATPDDVAMGHTMSGYWTAFVRAGDPNGSGRPAWPPYDPASPQVLSFTNQGVTLGPDPLQARLDLWRAVWNRTP